MLYEKIKEDVLIARKSSSTNTVVRDLLVTLLSDLSMIEKNTGTAPSDVQVYALIKKYLDNNVEFQGFNPDAATLEKLTAEANILKGYMPQQMPDTQMDLIITDFTKDSVVSIGQIMAHFKMNYSGQYDGKVLSNKVKSTLGLK